jgi:hypothetical protein
MATQQNRGQQTVIKAMGPQQAQQAKQMAASLGGLFNFGTINWRDLFVDFGKGAVDFFQSTMLPKIAARNGTLAMLAAVVADSLEAWLNAQQVTPTGMQGSAGSQAGTTRGMQPPTP